MVKQDLMASLRDVHMVPVHQAQLFCRSCNRSWTISVQRGFSIKQHVNLPSNTAPWPWWEVLQLGAGVRRHSLGNQCGSLLSVHWRPNRRLNSTARCSERFDKEVNVCHERKSFHANIDIDITRSRWHKMAHHEAIQKQCFLFVCLFNLNNFS